MADAAVQANPDAASALVSAAVSVADAGTLADLPERDRSDVYDDGSRWSAIHRQTYVRVLPIYELQFADLAAELWADTLDLYRRLITCTDAS